MIIENIFQGKIPIRRIYLNGHIVWKPPAYLPPYLVYLDTNTLTDQTLSKIHIESGNLVADNVGKMHVTGAPIGLDLFLVNRDVTEEYALTSIKNAMNALHIEQIKGEYLEGPELFAKKYGMSLDAMIGSRIVEEETYFLGNEVGLSARGAVLPHDVLLKFLFESLVSGVSSTGRIVEYDVSENFPIDHNATGLGANSKLGDFDRLINFLVDHNATALGANSKLGDFDRLINFLVDHNATGLAANGKLGDFDRLIDFLVDHNATGIGANSKTGDRESIVGFLIDPNIIALTGKAELGNATATLTTKTVTDRHLNSLKTTLIEHDKQLDLKYDASVNVPSISAETMTFTKYGDIYEAESAAIKIDAVGMNHDSTIKPLADTTATICAMFWLFPVQTDSDLYIPQIYDNGVITGAVQNGSELVM